VNAVESLTNLKHEISQGSTILVDFMAEWCQPCKAMLPTLEEASFRFPGVKFLQCNLDKVPEAGNAFGVASLPTVLLFKGGKMINRNNGSLSRSRLNDFVESAL